MSTLPDVAIGAIVAALIAAVVALLGLIISKEQKVSDFRQDWIDALRADVARLIAHANAVHGAWMSESKTIEKQWDRCRTDYLAMNEAAAAIRLRLNAGEEESSAILKTIDDLEEFFGVEPVTDSTKLNTLEKELVRVTKKVLKSEWVRVRGGELVFRTAKYLAALLVVGLLATAISLAFASWTRPAAIDNTAVGLANN